VNGSTVSVEVGKPAIPLHFSCWLTTHPEVDHTVVTRALLTHVRSSTDRSPLTPSGCFATNLTHNDRHFDFKAASKEAVVCQTTPVFSKSLSLDQTGSLSCMASASSSTSSGSRRPMRFRASAREEA